MSVSDVSDVEVSDVSSVDSSSDDDSDDDDSVVDHDKKDTNKKETKTESSSSSSSSSDGSGSSSSSDSSSDSSDSSDSEDEEDYREAKRREAAEKAKAAAAAAANWKPSPLSKKKSKNDTTTVITKAGTDGAQAQISGTPFKRVDDSYWGDVATKQGGAIADNSYEGAFGASGFGVKASEKLLTVRGKDFCREKNKRKRTFNGFSKSAGGSIGLKSFSTKFQYDDE